MKQTLAAIPALKDNYIWRLNGQHGYLLVDPGDPKVVSQLLRTEQAPQAILITHCHRDHIDGIATILELWPTTPVYGPAALAEQVPTHHYVSDTQQIHIDGFAAIEVIAVPGHTLDHLAYLVQQTPQILFCGDTLFSAGCGRLFEGTPAQMWQSLQQLSALPEDTWVCPTHEYTVSNLRFALQVEPTNPMMVDYLAWCEAQRSMDLPTLPSTIARELTVNPFLRCNNAMLQHHWQQPDALALFTMLRQWKNQA